MSRIRVHQQRYSTKYDAAIIQSDQLAWVLDGYDAEIEEVGSVSVLNVYKEMGMRGKAVYGACKPEGAKLLLPDSYIAAQGPDYLIYAVGEFDARSQADYLRGVGLALCSPVYASVSGVEGTLARLGYRIAVDPAVPTEKGGHKWTNIVGWLLRSLK